MKFIGDDQIFCSFKITIFMFYRIFIILIDHISSYQKLIYLFYRIFSFHHKFCLYSFLLFFSQVKSLISKSFFHAKKLYFDWWFLNCASILDSISCIEYQILKFSIILHLEIWPQLSTHKNFEKKFLHQKSILLIESKLHVLI